MQDNEGELSVSNGWGSSDFGPDWAEAARCGHEPEPPGNRLTIIGGGIQAMGTRVEVLFGRVKNTMDVLASNGAANRASVRCRGQIGQCGMRCSSRDARYGRGAAGPACAADGVTEAQYMSYLHGIQEVCNTAEAACNQQPDLEGELQDAFESMMLHCGDLAGSVSWSYLASAIGVDCACAMHKDAQDCSMAMMISAGKKAAQLALPEYETVLVLNPGDILCFYPQRMYHGLINSPIYRPKKPEVVVISLYNNEQQFKKWAEEE
jgi:hypothetical protein